MPEELVVAQCSPTLAGLKTGSLFSCPLEDKRKLTDSIRRMNARLVPRGAKMIPVKYMENRVLIYMYRPNRLKADLSDEIAMAILEGKRYPVGNPALCVAELIRRLNNDETFPHEVGLFLGYPSEDVAGFIRFGAKHAKCVGTWKVYGDERAAREKFELFQKCTKAYKKAYDKYNSIDRLIVSCS